MDESRLDSILRSLADAIDWPTPSPHLAARVVAGIEERRGLAGKPSRRRLAVITAAVMVVATLVVLSPAAREAAADLFRAAGIRIGLTAEEAPAAGADLALGRPIDLEDLRGAVDFVVRIPTGPFPGPPDGIYLDDDGRVTMVWVGSPVLPASGDTDVALLLTQGEASGREVAAQKEIGPGIQIRSLQVEGGPALWIEGAPHTLTLIDVDGNPVEETTRLAANVLLWEANGVDHRLETTGDLESALTIVETLEELP